MLLLRRQSAVYDRIPDRVYVISMEFLSLSRDVPPRETSPAARSEEKRLFSQALLFLVLRFCKASFNSPKSSFKTYKNFVATLG